MTRSEHAKIVKRVVAAAGLSPLAKKLGITKQAVSKWPQVPAIRVLQVEAITGIPRKELRPDIFGR